ncbi:MAG TPA: hypothetical protein VD969_15540 [Symbiobacteriaceae bacterium]|nr:hypothetical protein [Symbiobacteriaceae bacterium]
MLLSIGVLVGESALAYLVLEAVFRYVDVSPAGLAVRLRRWCYVYASLAAAAGLAGAWAQFRLAGPMGLAVAAGNWVPWWLLWRFGLRKQLTFLIKDDGGTAYTKPDR